MAERNYAPPAVRGRNYSPPAHAPGVTGAKVPIRADLVQTASGQKPRVRANADGSFTISGIDGNTYFGPAQPFQPLAQDPSRGAVGRQFDYQFGYNLQYTPRGQEDIGFREMRALAENFDVLRLGIETRKDQMAALDYTIQPRDKKKGGEVDSVIEFFRYPDKDHDYAEWMRALLEDRFVIDAATIYPRYTNGGQLYAVELVDGATIKPLIDASGRRPMAPDPCYQQILKGIPAVDYTRDELIYRPYNVRTHKVYGYSPVEQIIMTVNIALRRQVSQLNYYTEGSIPDAFGQLPDNWTPGMISEFQSHWDSLFENQSGANTAKRKMRWIPGVKGITFAKDNPLKDEYDEWLARIVCYALSLEPTPFIKQMNRATAENQKQQSRAEGIIPLKKWWKSFMDFIITYHLKRPDLEFAWQDEEATDPLEQAQIDEIDVNCGIKTVNEVRDDRGLEPLPEPEEDEPRMQTTEAVAGQQPANPAQPGAPAAQHEQAPAVAAAKFAELWINGLRKAGGDKAAIKVKAPKFVSGVGVPYLAGASDDGETVYFDSHLPKTLKGKNGKRFDPRDFIAVHEIVEWTLVTELKLHYLQAHEIANRAEAAAAAARGIDPEEYNELLQAPEEAAYEAAKSGEMTDIPEDLATYPYEDESEMELLGRAEKMTKSALKAVVRNRRPVQIQAQRLTRAIKRAFKQQADTVAAHFKVGKMVKADPSDPSDAGKDADEELDKFDFDGLWSGWDETVADPLRRAGADGVETGADSLGTQGVEVSLGKDFVDTWSKSYAEDRGAEMVGKKWVDGALVDNPDAKWVITSETRAGIRSVLVNAIQDGWSNDRLASELRQANAFSPARAERIARSETEAAAMSGHLASWKESGVVEKKEWLLAGNGDQCPVCQGNADAGAIDLDDDFPSGDDAPGAHPNCECSMRPVVAKQ